MTLLGHVRIVIWLPLFFILKGWAESKGTTIGAATGFVQVSSKRVAGRLVCFGDNNFEGQTLQYVKRLDRNVNTFRADGSAIFANNGVCAIQSYCPPNKPADLPLLYWRPVAAILARCADFLEATGT